MGQFGFKILTVNLEKKTKYCPWLRVAGWKQITTCKKKLDKQFSSFITILIISQRAFAWSIHSISVLLLVFEGQLIHEQSTVHFGMNIAQFS